MTETESRFELKVEGISCVKCAGRIEDALKSHDQPGINIRVDILTNNVVFSIRNRTHLDTYIEILNQKGYTVKKVADVTQINERDKRIIRLKLISGDSNIILVTLRDLNGL